jgi:F0F1-type ATP synthase membrane subunit b/b'
MQKTKQAQETLAQEKQAVIANIGNLVTKATMIVIPKLLEKPLDSGDVKNAIKHIMKKKSA